MFSVQCSAPEGKRAKLLFVMLLTFIRFPLVLIFFGLAIAYSQHQYGWMFVVAFTSIIASAVTDLFDGYFARKFGVETRFGAHADPLMDKFFYLATMPLLVFVAARDGNTRHAVALLILTTLFLTRDQWVTFLRSIGSMYDVSGCANWSGKVRTALNFPLICCIYHFEEAPRQIINPTLLYTFEVIAAIVNIVSVCVYTRHYWPWLLKAMDLKKESN